MLLLLICFFFLNPASAYFLNEEDCLNYTVYPVQYELILYPQVLTHENSYYDCDLTITVIANIANVRRIQLDAKDLEINRDSVHVFNQNGVDIINNVRPYEYDRRAGKIYLYLKKDLDCTDSLRNSKYQIKMFFRKFLKSEQSGIFVVTYEENGQTNVVGSVRLVTNLSNLAGYMDEDGLEEMQDWLNANQTSIPEYSVGISAINSARTSMQWGTDRADEILAAARGSAAALIPTALLLVCSLLAMLLK